MWGHLASSCFVSVWFVKVELKWSRDAPAFAEVVGTVEEAERLVAKEIEVSTISLWWKLQ